MQHIIGIDLGTTYSCVAVFNEKKGVFEVLPSGSGQQTTPSVVGVNPKGEVIVGDSAKRQLAAKPTLTVAEIKRHMGELTRDGKPYVVQFAGREHSPEEISAYILRDLKAAAEKALGTTVSAAVITVPAYFEEPQRQATIRAGKLAGLDVKRIINEPTAAAIAYGHDKQDEDDEDESLSRPVRLLIYDLGGGTFDVSVIEAQRGNLRVKSTHGNHYLGGVDFDQVIAAWACAQIKARNGVDIEHYASLGGKEGQRGREALAKIRTDAENYKKELSSQETVTLQFALLPVVDPRTGEMLENVELELTRAGFEQMIAAKIRETLDSVDLALKDAKLEPKDIDEVILVGGSTRIPMVKRMLTRHFGKEPRTNIHPDLCVALGAAQEAVKHIDVSKIETPEMRSQIERTIAEMPSVVDVTGHSLGVAEQGRYMSSLIARQSPIPAMVTKSYVTMADNQRSVCVMIFQGEHNDVQFNTKLREFELDNLPPRPAGGVEIDITFALDSNATLWVTARDKITGQQKEVTVHDERLRAAPANGLLPSAGSTPPRAQSGAMPMGAADPIASTAPADPVTAGATPAPIPERYRKFVDQARDLLPKLAPSPAARLRTAVEALENAARGGNATNVETAANDLMDVLFEVRP